MKKLLIGGVALAVLVGCSNPVNAPAFKEQPAISVSKPATAPASLSSLPKWIRVPEIGVDSSLIYTNLNPDGTIETPSVHQPKQASWYSGSPRPGDVGPAIVLGHVDGDHQQGVFYRLRELKVGSKVDIEREDGSTVSFTVYKVVHADKDEFPTNLVYGNTAGSEIRLITCGGAFDRSKRSYEDNIIVFGKR
jgi:sortase (surface protein transpeptidase)